MRNSHSFHSLDAEKGPISFTFGHTIPSMLETKSPPPPGCSGSSRVGGWAFRACRAWGGALPTCLAAPSTCPGRGLSSHLAAWYWVVRPLPPPRPWWRRGAGGTRNGQALGASYGALNGGPIGHNAIVVFRYDHQKKGR